MKTFSRIPIDIETINIPQGQVYIIPERCKGCEICVDFCPKDVLQVSDLRNEKGYHYPSVVPQHEVDCVHCEFCTMICPEFAIYTLEVGP